MLGKVLEDVELVLPEPMIVSRASQIEYEFIYSMEAQGASVKDYMEQSDEQKQAFSKHFYKQAEAILRQEMVLEAIAEAEGLEVTDEDFLEEVNRAAESMGRDVEELLEKTREQKHEQEIRDDLLRNKASKLLAEKAVPVMKTAAEIRARAEAEAAAAVAESETESEAKIEAGHKEADTEEGREQAEA